MTDEQYHEIDEYFTQLLARYINMDSAGVDTRGLKRVTDMLNRYVKTGYITPGEFQYCYDRTDPKGRYPRYMTNKRYRVYGTVMNMPTRVMAQEIVDWSCPHDREFRLKTLG
jgi:hypothetical protein